MKVISVLMISALLLTSCGTSTPKSVGGGSVISCSTIPTDATKTSGTTLECLDGNSKVLLESIKGPALINVWGSWCIPCREEMPYLRALAATGKVQIIGIDVEEADMESARKFVVDQGMTWPNLYDKDGSTKSSFGMGVPVTWYLNGDGEVAYKHLGVLKSEAQLFAEVLALLILGAFIHGYRAGFLKSIFSLVGYVGGGVLGLALGWNYLQDWQNVFGKFALLLLAISIGASIGQWLLSKFAEFFHKKLLLGPIKWLDSLLGAAFSVIRIALMVYLVATICLATPWQWADKNIPTSRIYQEIDTYTPMIIKNVTNKIESFKS